MNDTSILQARDDNRVLLKYTGVEDLNLFLTNFQECMTRMSYGGIMHDEDDYEPRRPDGAFLRRSSSSLVPPFPTDSKEISEFLKREKDWRSGCAVVLASFKACLTSLIKDYLDNMVPDFKEATRENLMNIKKALILKYGGWNATIGQRNYFQMLSIEIFTSIETVTKVYLV